jgi:hypothetical protein
MRKAISKISREDKKSEIRSNDSGRRLKTSKYNIARLPVFSVVDDEEYFFEVEDF